MTDSEDSLVRRLRQFQADEPGFPPLFSKAADQIEALQREILRCDDACFKRDKKLAEVVREREDYNGMHQLAVMEIDRLRAALLKVRNWLDVQFNEPFKNNELAEHIGLINEVLPVLAISNGDGK